MNSPLDPRAAQATRHSGSVKIAGVSEALRTFALLAAAGFAAFMPFVAGYELTRVRAVSQWPLVPARIVSATLEPSAFRKGVSSWRYRVVDLHTGEALETGDMRPGDLPFSIVIWSTAILDAARFQARVGQTINIRRAPSGSAFYLEAGDGRFMSGVLMFCALFWGWVYWRRNASDQSD
jgi:hypothetical protein